jgi:predicted RNase H-like nuclease
MALVSLDDAHGSERWVAGVDGCRGGWLVALLRLDRRDPRLRLLRSFADVLALPLPLAAIAVDMPIGLPARSGRGGRPCDVAARAKLGERQSSLFAVPSRRALMETDYTAACRAALATSDPPRKVSKQCFSLFAKIREVDAVMTPALQAHVIECHPELAFVAMNVGRPLALPKKVQSRVHPPGLALRESLLAAAGLVPLPELELESKASQWGPDDRLDAMACAWSAARYARGEAVAHPGEVHRDARSLAMQIWS